MLTDHKPQPCSVAGVRSHQFMVTGSPGSAGCGAGPEEETMSSFCLCFAVPAVPKPHEGAGGVLQENQGGRPEV